MNTLSRLLLACAALAALLVPATASVAAPRGLPGDPYAAYLAPLEACPNQARSDVSVKAQTKAMICLVNWARRHDKLAPLRPSTLLDRASKIKARDIVRCNQFSHTPCGEPFESAFKKAGYLKRPGYVGENIYWATAGYSSPRTAFNAWLHSDGHRQNLLGASWRDLGIGRVVTQNVLGSGMTGVIWVNQFGRRL